MCISKLSILPIVGLFISKCLFAQTIGLKPMVIGDSLPDLTLHVSNSELYKPTELKTSNLKGKIIIFDFWTTLCIPCIKEFSKLDSLQNVFGDKIQIFLVNPDTTETQAYLDSFFSNQKKLKASTLPSIVRDTVLIKLFPATASGLHVWIDGDGVFRSRHFGSISSDDVKSMITKKILQRQSDVNIDFGKYPISKNPFSLADLYRSQKPNDLFCCSYITGRINGLYGFRSLGEIEQVLLGDTVNKIMLPNFTILDMFKVAYNESFGKGKYDLFRTVGPSNSIILKAKNSNRLFWPKFEMSSSEFEFQKWMDDNLFCYQLSVSPNYPIGLFEVMKHDLEKFFGLRAEIHKQKVKSLVLVRVKNSKVKLPFSDASHSKMVTYGKNGVDSINFRFDDFFSKVGGYLTDLPTPFVDGTNLNHDEFLNFRLINSFFVRLNDSLKINQTNSIEQKLAIIKKSLKSYGLTIVEDYRLQNVLVIEDIKKNDATYN